MLINGFQHGVVETSTILGRTMTKYLLSENFSYDTRPVTPYGRCMPPNELNIARFDSQASVATRKGEHKSPTIKSQPSSIHYNKPRCVGRMLLHQNCSPEYAAYVWPCTGVHSDLVFDYWMTLLDCSLTVQKTKQCG